LVVMGLVHPSKIKRNADARAGDKLILGKPLGVGVLSAALKKGALDDAGYAAMIENTTKLNKPGKALSELAGVHALTDVTGFGLLGHLLELARGAGLEARLDMGSIPLLPGVQQLAEGGYVTGASGRNWAGYGHDVSLAAQITPVQQMLLTDPQTSGGLLVACAPETLDEVLALFAREGFAHAAVIGEMAPGKAGVSVG
ncbi:MAG: selD, partial [Burkholderia sp.]|nr:selD [Burkholderia sp.]